MKPLEPPDSHFVSSAVGWLELGNAREAAAELAGVAPALARHPAVLQTWYQIHAHADRWDLASETASALALAMPDDPQAWTNLAYATRRKPGGGLPRAKEILLAARQRFPSEVIIAYNLACYECQLGNLPQARGLLRAAFKLGDAAELKRMSLRDPDLAPLHLEITLL
jgi:hypothetical protein